MNLSRLHIRLLILAPFLAMMLFSANSQNPSGEPIELKYADSMVGNKIGDGNIRKFVGHVKFIQGNVTVTSNLATQYLDENRADLSGDVIVRQEDMVLTSQKINWNGNTNIAQTDVGVTITDKNQLLKARRGTYNTQTMIADFDDHVIASDDTVRIDCDHIQYHRRLRKSYARGNVKVEDDSTIILADYGEYDRSTRESYAYGNVLIKGKHNSTYLTGDTIFSIPPQGYTLAKGNPVLNQIDTIKKTKRIKFITDSFNLADKDTTYFEYDTLSVISAMMEQLKGADEIFMFEKNVKIARKRVSAIADTAIFYKTSGLIILKGSPIVWYDSTQLHADSIIMKLPGNKLSEIHAFGNSLAASRSDSLDATRINQIIGKEILIKFDNDSIRAMFSYGAAKSLYFMQNEKGEDGMARNSCDTIFIEFSNSEIENIHWLSGIQGEFFPENIVNSPKDYYLPNYRWSDDRPKPVTCWYLKPKIKTDRNSQDDEEIKKVKE